jgi:hypothetical protein
MPPRPATGLTAADIEIEIDAVFHYVAQDSASKDTLLETEGTAYS